MSDKQDNKENMAVILILENVGYKSIANLPILYTRLLLSVTFRHQPSNS